MITKVEYHKLKNYLRNLSKPEIKQLCTELELNIDEKDMLIDWYDGESVVKAMLDNYISNTTYTKYMKKIFSKINNYYSFIGKTI